MDLIKTHPLAVYLILVNTGLFCLMGLDKLKAKMDSWRISEKTLLLLGLAGGGIGGLMGQQLFHHKTRKKYFTVCFAIGGIISVAVLLWYYLR